MTQIFQPFTRVVNILIAINILLFAIHSLVPGGLNHLFALYFPRNEHFADWQFITHMFMHGNVMHILFNMFGLWMFGTQIESVLGKIRFLAFYFACGIGAALIYTAVNSYEFNGIYSRLINSGVTSSDINLLLQSHNYLPSGIAGELFSQLLSIYYVPMVGASGALYGVLVAYAFFFPNNKLVLIFFPYPIAAKYFVPILIGLDLFSGITGFSLFGGGIAYFAHVGGALIGFILMYVWRQRLATFN